MSHGLIPLEQVKTILQHSLNQTFLKAISVQTFHISFTVSVMQPPDCTSSLPLHTQALPLSVG